MFQKTCETERCYFCGAPDGASVVRCAADGSWSYPAAGHDYVVLVRRISLGEIGEDERLCCSWCGESAIRRGWYEHRGLAERMKQENVDHEPTEPELTPQEKARNIVSAYWSQGGELEACELAEDIGSYSDEEAVEALRRECTTSLDDGDALEAMRWYRQRIAVTISLFEDFEMHSHSIEEVLEAIEDGEPVWVLLTGEGIGDDDVLIGELDEIAEDIKPFCAPHGVPDEWHLRRLRAAENGLEVDEDFDEERPWEAITINRACEAPQNRKISDE